MFRVALNLRRHLPDLPAGRRSEIVRGGLAVGLAAIAVLALGFTSRTLLPADAGIRTTGAYLTTSDEWLDQLTNPSAWRNGRLRGRSRPMSREEARREREQDERDARDERLREEREEREEAMERAREYGRERGTYRTVCVRLCDGFFFPISFATTPDRFGADEAACNARCASGARLYVYPNPGGEPEDMRDVRGQPYTALKNAFLFRTEYVEACTCKPHPWEQEALARHRHYAERAQKGRRAVAAKVHPTALARGTPNPIDLSAPKPPDGPGAPGELAEDRTRPDGAMLLGSPETKRPTRRAARGRSAGKEAPPRERRPTAASRAEGSHKPSWASRVFGGNY
jgi:hypothetical protein